MMAIIKNKDFKIPSFVKEALVGISIALSAILFLFISAVVVPKIVHYRRKRKQKRARELVDRAANEKRLPEGQSENTDGERRSRSNIAGHPTSAIRETEEDHPRRGRCPIPRPTTESMTSFPNSEITRLKDSSY
ncbi:hypothetical protein TWF694_010159 [Orbilia ellipsospora]|uniref:Uncharacterized protein n=1 Tax=Orbilia ellipsospora TaxID=2528407 RepID=A0AAV9XAE7_9PEZI